MQAVGADQPLLPGSNAGHGMLGDLYLSAAFEHGQTMVLPLALQVEAGVAGA
ncbi:hypothetical protein D3C80_1783640 [compost metagenome]